MIKNMIDKIEMKENLANGFIVRGQDKGNMKMALTQKARISSLYSQPPSSPSMELGDAGPFIIRRNDKPKLSRTTTTYAMRHPKE
mmetsp:Transcript_22632/g.47247  ORF Transcript_22632/g.47247 Transcript_22632/m.47247 type:complete len:85 (+) Transcript_22632:1262-1516(+)